MSRSLKKGPYINVKLEKKVLAMNESGKKVVVKTWARASMISPDFVGHTVAVHNGNKFIPVYVTSVSSECTSWSELAQLVSYHIFGNINRNKFISIVNCNSMAYEIRRNH